MKAPQRDGSIRGFQVALGSQMDTCPNLTEQIPTLAREKSGTGNWVNTVAPAVQIGRPQALPCSVTSTSGLVRTAGATLKMKGRGKKKRTRKTLYFQDSP